MMLPTMAAFNRYCVSDIFYSPSTLNNCSSCTLLGSIVALSSIFSASGAALLGRSSMPAVLLSSALCRSVASTLVATSGTSGFVFGVIFLVIASIARSSPIVSNTFIMTRAVSGSALVSALQRDGTVCPGSAPKSAGRTFAAANLSAEAAELRAGWCR